MLSPNACARYFKSGSLTRRYSVIGCVGYENASPSCIPGIVETVEIGVGTSNCDNGDNTCAICMECFDSGCAPQKNIATTECGHTFCLSCLLKNLHTSNLCPLCRAPVEQNVKRVLKPLSYSDGIGLLDHELNGLQIYEDIEQFVQNAMEVSSQSNTDGQNVEDVIGDIMTMVTNFGFNLLYDATLHTNGSEEHMDPEWIVQMYNDNDDGSSMNDDDSDDDTNSDSGDSESESESEHDDDEDDDEDHDEDDDEDHDEDDDVDDSKNKRIVLPEVPESMLE
jgi:hypothetical protein